MLIFDNLANRIENLTIPVKEEMEYIEFHVDKVCQRYVKYPFLKLLGYELLLKYNTKNIAKRFKLIPECQDAYTHPKNEIFNILKENVLIEYNLNCFPHNSFKKISYTYSTEDFVATFIFREFDGNNLVYSDAKRPQNEDKLLYHNFELHIKGIKEKYQALISVLQHANFEVYDQLENDIDSKNPNKSSSAILEYIFNNINLDKDFLLDNITLNYDSCNKALEHYSHVIQSLKHFLTIPNQEDLCQRKRYREVLDFYKNY